MIYPGLFFSCSGLWGMDQHQGLPNITHIKYPALLLETLVFLVAMSHTE